MPEITPHQRFRVPRADRSLLAIPGLESGMALAESNRALFAASACSLHGRSLHDLRMSARRDALKLARKYTSTLIQSDLPEATAESLVVSGHQPELFHVGVWAKNFALAAVAKQCESVPLNLIIDNDTLNGTSIRIPAGARDSLHIDRVPFDAPRSTQPWEEAEVRDRELFRRFGFDVRERMQSNWGFDPLIGTAWDAALNQLEISERLCDCLTAVRVNVERAWGQGNLELPMSQLCNTESFLWFAAHLLIRLPEVHTVYNDTVIDYRRVHRLRNRMQPVPNLDFVDDWLEAPFWIWRRGDFQRGRLFARQKGTVCELRDEKEIIVRLPITETGSLDAAVRELDALKVRGFRLRTRALTTTLFARVCLADLFLHGIGGAKYDEMTDRICERLFGMTAPHFLTVSATLHLPLGGPFTASDDELRLVKHDIRDLMYNPDRHLADFPRSASLVREKSEIIAAANLLRQSEQLRGRLTPDQHRRLAKIRAELQSYTGTIAAHYESERTRLETQLSANSLIRNREYSFVLYPEEHVRQFLVPLANTTFKRIGQDSKQPLDNGPPRT
jgi:hypothetical protein